MGSGIGFIYAVPRRDLLGAPGSRNKDMVEEIASGYWQMESVAQMIEDDDLPIDLAEAVSQIVNGEQLAPGLGSLYLYAVEAICWYLGTTLVLPIGFCGEDSIDEVLSAHRCPLRMVDIVSSGSPIPIPEPGCPPSIGWWTPEVVRAGTPLINGLALDLESTVAEGLVEVRRWLTEAERIPDGCLVGTCY